MKKKPPKPLDLTHTFEGSMVIEGETVWFTIDATGEPHSMMATGWWGDDPHRLREAKLAIRAARAKLRRAVIDAHRTSNSAKERRKDAREHWANEWLEKANREDPTLGAASLARRARQPRTGRQRLAGCRARPRAPHRARRRSAQRR